MIRSAFWAKSIGNHDVVKDLKRMFPEIGATWLAREGLSLPGSGHVSALPADSTRHFLAKDFDGRRYSQPQPLTAADIQRDRLAKLAAEKLRFEPPRQQALDLSRPIGLPRDWNRRTPRIIFSRPNPP